MNERMTVGIEAIERKGLVRAHKFLILRRLSQLGILGLFLAGSLFGIWIIKGNLTSSLLLDTIPMTDPFVFLQSWFAGHIPQKDVIIGVIVISIFYLLVGGRVYCSWFCPMNIITDTANWLRRKFNLKGSGVNIDKTTRYWILAMTLITALIIGKIAWEIINPVSILHRGIIFGMGLGWLFIFSIFMFELIICVHGWCGRLCPVGAFYSLLGKLSFLRISAAKREKCDDCMDCFAICPEPQVINPALKGSGSALITDSMCTNCGRCIDICAEDVFHYSNIFKREINSEKSTQNIRKLNPKEAVK